MNEPERHIDPRQKGSPYARKSFPAFTEEKGGRRLIRVPRKPSILRWKRGTRFALMRKDGNIGRENG